ncbi:MAG: TlpA family protein disulfide reductase [Hyphomicrobiaceae bacterium]|nr:MAG: TlpA family protein disulfide reductase [Hyphomicrobiaceae bacterium]
MRALVLTALLLTALAGAPRAAAPERFILHEVAREVPALTFADGTGQERALSDFRGRVVLLNVWATWCGPCRREMPALDRLQTQLGGLDFEVVALSIDRAGADAVRKFYAETGVRNLNLYIDTSGGAARQLQAVGLPITVLIDRNGRELGRLIGPAEWDTPEMIGFLKRILAERAGQLLPRSHSRARASTTDQGRPDPCDGGSLKFAVQQERSMSHA